MNHEDAIAVTWASISGVSYVAVELAHPDLIWIVHEVDGKWFRWPVTVGTPEKVERSEALW